MNDSKAKTASTMKLSMKIDSEPNREELLFAKQLGLNYVFTWITPQQRDYQSLLDLRQNVENAGLILYNAGDYTLGKSDKIHLALPGRDETIEAFKSFIRNLGQAGIHTTTFTWEPSRVWSSEPGETRGGAVSRRVDLEEMQRQPLTHGREYSEEEIWQNFEYFIKQILPVAEEADVRLALHPNDPPAKSLGGIPCLIHSFESYKRAFEIADSPYLGMEFCTGCWLEGGDAFGNMLEAIRYFHEQRKIFIVHFRNVSSTLPYFVETFLDNGYMDMYEVMKVFCEIGYDGTMTLDHTPHFAPGFDQGTGTAYAIGYMRALIERAEAGLHTDT